VDTNIVSYLMSGKEPASMCARHLEGRVAALSFQSVGELWYGAVKSGWAERKIRVLDERIARFVVLAYDEATVREWAELKAQAETAGLPRVPQTYGSPPRRNVISCRSSRTTAAS
jgi:predicted nucleic acid-binding protein